MKNYIKNKKRLTKGNFLTLNSINVVVKDEIMFDFDMSELEDTIKLFPKSFFSNIDYIMFGNFDFLRKKNYNASYMDGIIYVLNTQENNTDVVDDIVHEIGHSVEEKYDELIYGDGTIESEFLNKRKLMQKEFNKEGYFVSDRDANNPDYNEEFDLFLSDEVGYPKMTTMIQGIYYSPYAATSLREYFANGFEAYFYHKDIYLKKVSPILYGKLEELEEEKYL